jgi:hypothetical protein
MAGIFRMKNTIMIMKNKLKMCCFDGKAGFENTGNSLHRGNGKKQYRENLSLGIQL